jgi:hypothetical protein
MTFGVRQLLALSLVAACGGGAPAGTSVAKSPGAQNASGAPPAAGLMHLSGTVRSQIGVRTPPTTVYLAEVKATIDRNHDGSISAGELWTTASDGDGAYALDVPVVPGDTLVVRFSDVNSAAVLRTVKAAPSGSVILNVTLGDLQEPECIDTGCRWGHADLALVDLPSTTRVSVSVFNPLTEGYALPDHMQDSAGNLLVPAVFASFQLEDETGNRPAKLATTVGMRLEVPKETWDIVRDIDGRDDLIDVPLYWFDEVKGSWVRNPVPAHLEDGERNLIPPSSLPAIRDGSFAGPIYAVGAVNHFSTWIVAWPIGAAGHLSGRVLDEAGNPAEGAAVTLKGVSYAGASTTVVAGPDGRFCLDARRSEAPGEDLDGNGRVGEKATVSIDAEAGGNFYDLGQFQTPLAADSCGGEGSLDLGDLGLTPATRRNAQRCTIHGTASLADGLLGAGDVNHEVSLWDDGAPPDLLSSVCDTGLDGTCATAHFDLETGAFTVAAPVLRALKLEAGVTREIEPGVFEVDVARRNFSSCPKEAVALTLTPLSTMVHFAPRVAGNTISWTPSRYGVSVVTVWSASGMKWQSQAWDGTVMRAPITYGELGSGAFQSYPPHGRPVPLAPGDWVSVETRGAEIDGVPYFGSGTTAL